MKKFIFSFRYYVALFIIALVIINVNISSNQFQLSYKVQALSGEWYIEGE